MLRDPSLLEAEGFEVRQSASERTGYGFSLPKAQCLADEKPSF